ncbi:unnamed protein product [Linum trigynum]|uniref:Uncharacterized protein n=1 Tax=Linum trigynum TaxID=586398 RepID=A0AAV2ED73_9ROSI
MNPYLKPMYKQKWLATCPRALRRRAGGLGNHGWSDSFSVMIGGRRGGGNGSGSGLRRTTAVVQVRDYRLNLGWGNGSGRWTRRGGGLWE